MILACGDRGAAGRWGLDGGGGTNSAPAGEGSGVGVWSAGKGPVFSGMARFPGEGGGGVDIGARRDRALGFGRGWGNE